MNWALGGHFVHLVVCLFCSDVGDRTWVSRVLDKCSTTELHPQDPSPGWDLGKHVLHLLCVCAPLKRDAEVTCV